MAGKQLGKLRQWAGEVISSKDKVTTVTEEFRELERDIDLRRDGTSSLLSASEAYIHVLTKKKDNESLEESEKLLPIDALGLTMIAHGEEYGDESAFGTSLVKLGGAHCKIATMQETFALDFRETYLASLQRTMEDIKDYEHQRKKLDSRRLSYDAAMTKMEKLKSAKKMKDKDLKDAEEELQKARLRYEETSEDVRTRIYAIQESELQQLKELTSLLDLEVQYMQHSLNILREVRDDWPDESSLKRIEVPRSNGPSHIFARGMPETIRSVSSITSKSVSSITDNTSEETSEPQKRPGHAHRKSDASTMSRPSSRPPSRPPSRTARQRTDSTSTVGEEKKEKARKRSVAGWASSLTGRGKRDREQFTALQDSDDGDGESVSRASSIRSKKDKKSKESLGKTSPDDTRLPKTGKDKKIVRALYNFAGSSDELSFSVGDEIVVLNEVLDDWWLGELDGRTGLFPTAYAEVTPSSSQRLALMHRQDPYKKTIASSDDDTGTDDNHPGKYGESDLEDDSGSRFDMQSPISGTFDTASVTDSVVEEEEKKKLMPRNPSEDSGDVYAPTSSNYPTRGSPPRPVPPMILTQSAPEVRKAPPPPPPRRYATNALPVPPPVPQRRVRAQSNISLNTASPSPSLTASSNTGSGHDVSPFESAADLAST